MNSKEVNNFSRIKSKSTIEHTIILTLPSKFQNKARIESFAKHKAKSPFHINLSAGIMLLPPGNIPSPANIPIQAHIVKNLLSLLPTKAKIKILLTVGTMKCFLPVP